MIDIFLQAKLDPRRAINRVLINRVLANKGEHNNMCLGMNISQIARYLKLSRITVSRHCRRLCLHDKIFGKKLGRSMVYYAKSEQK